MKLKDKIKSYSFWVSLASAIILILKILGNRFGFTVDETMVSDLFTALCSILVLLGIIVVPSTSSTNETKTQTQRETEKELTIVNHSISSVEKVNLNSQSKMKSDETLANTITAEDSEKIIQGSVTQSSDSTIHELTSSENNAEVSSEDTAETSLEDIAQNNLDSNLMEEPPQITINNQEPQDSLCVVNTIENVNDDNTQLSLSKISELKNLFVLEREKFSNNINEYILELQEEIRRAREQM